MSDIHLRVLPRVWSTGADWDWEVEQVEEEEGKQGTRQATTQILKNLNWGRSQEKLNQSGNQTKLEI